MEPVEVEKPNSAGVRPKRPGRLRRTLAVLVVGTIVGAVVAETGVAWAATYNVTARRVDGVWRWRPKHRYIERNDYIRWRNPTTRVHNVVAYGGNWSYSRTLDPGESVRRRFRSRGNFRYRCTRHSALVNGVCSGQCGIIHVS